MEIFEAEEYDNLSQLKELSQDPDITTEGTITTYRILFRDAQKPWYSDTWCLTGTYSRPQSIPLKIWIQAQAIIKSVFNAMGIEEILEKAPERVKVTMMEKISIEISEETGKKEKIEAIIWEIIGQMFAQIFYQLAARYCLLHHIYHGKIPPTRDEGKENIEFLDATDYWHKKQIPTNPHIQRYCDILEKNFDTFIANPDNYARVIHNTLLRLLALFGEKIAKIPDGLIIESNRQRAKKYPPKKGGYL